MYDPHKSIGPNENMLICQKISLILIPKDTPPGQGFMKGINGIKRLGEPNNGIFKEAAEWVQDSIAAVRSAPYNTFTSDEEIAGEILHQIQLRNKS